MGVIVTGLLVLALSSDAHTSASVHTQAPSTIDRIVAVVNGSLITLSDMRAARMLQLVAEDVDDQALLQMLVDRQLVLIEMRRFQAPEPSPEALTARRRAWDAQLAGVDAAALAASAGVTMAFVDRWLSDDLRREAYLQQRFAALDGDRRLDAQRTWLEGLRTRAEIVYR